MYPNFCIIVYDSQNGRYLVCLENSGSKCKHLFSADDNINDCIFFTNITSTFNCLSLWYFVNDCILAIMYETQVLMSGLVTLHDSKSLSMRENNNSKCKHQFSTDDNIDNHIFFTNSTSTFHCLSSYILFMIPFLRLCMRHRHFCLV